MICFLGRETENMSSAEMANLQEKREMGKTWAGVKPEHEELVVEVLPENYVELDNYGRAGQREPLEKEVVNCNGMLQFREKFSSMEMRSTGRKLRGKLSWVRMRMTGRKVSCLVRALWTAREGKESCRSQVGARGEGGLGKVHEFVEPLVLTGPTPKAQIVGDGGRKAVGLNEKATQTLVGEIQRGGDEDLFAAPGKVLPTGSRVVELSRKFSKGGVLSSSDNLNELNETSFNVPPTDGDESAKSFSLLYPKEFDTPKPVLPDELETSSSSSPIVERGSQELPQSLTNDDDSLNARITRSKERIAFLKNYISENLPSLQHQTTCKEVSEGEPERMTIIQYTTIARGQTNVSQSSKSENSHSYRSSEAYIPKSGVEMSTGNNGIKEAIKKTISETSYTNRMSSSEEYHGTYEKKCDRSCDISSNDSALYEDDCISSGKFSSDWLYFIDEPDQEEWDEFVDHYVDSEDEFVYIDSESGTFTSHRSDGDKTEEMLDHVKKWAFGFSVFPLLLTLHLVCLNLVVG
ncbi:hypothetical protein FGB62_22g850 [Gracilaria domingensis]|nr:hypothetical protein FGB62_22g850 [Gracilaria domingensis]